MTQSVGANLSCIQHHIHTTALHNQRDPNSIRLLAVTKSQPIALIQQAIDNHQYRFGENYVQEGIAKIQYFKQHVPNSRLEWHFIGALQSNKTRLVAENFDWMQTLHTLKVAHRLAAQRPASLAPLNVLIQINISAEGTKSGIKPSDLLPFARQVVTLSTINLRGIMAIPDPNLDKEQQQHQYSELFALYQRLKVVYAPVDTLSLGMSHDIEAAIAAGSTMLRIGSALFGNRNKTQDSIVRNNE